MKKQFVRFLSFALVICFMFTVALKPVSAYAADDASDREYLIPLLVAYMTAAGYDLFVQSNAIIMSLVLFDYIDDYSASIGLSSGEWSDFIFDHVSLTKYGVFSCDEIAVKSLNEFLAFLPNSIVEIGYRSSVGSFDFSDSPVYSFPSKSSFSPPCMFDFSYNGSVFPSGFSLVFDSSAPAKTRLILDNWDIFQDNSFKTVVVDASALVESFGYSVNDIVGVVFVTNLSTYYGYLMSDGRVCVSNYACGIFVYSPSGFRCTSSDLSNLPEASFLVIETVNSENILDSLVAHDLQAKFVFVDPVEFTLQQEFKTIVNGALVAVAVGVPVLGVYAAIRLMRRIL